MENNQTTMIAKVNESTKDHKYESLVIADEQTWNLFSFEEIKHYAFYRSIIERKGAFYKFWREEVKTPDGYYIAHYHGMEL